MQFSATNIPYKERSSLPEETKSLLRDFDMFHGKQLREGQEVYQLILPEEYRKTALEELHDNAGHLEVETQ